MKLLAQSRTRPQRSASLLKWHHWFAWYPVVVRVDDELKHWVWLEHLERKWSLGEYGDRGHWRYRDPVERADLYSEQTDSRFARDDVARDGSEGRVSPDLGGHQNRPGESRLH
jgi:hypothetical protein